MDAPPAPSLWSSSSPPGLAAHTLSGTAHAQAIVVGAGYTGLSAALHLCEAGRDVAVIEAAEVGVGASGLNGGQVIPGLKQDPDALERLFGARLGAQLVQTTASGPDLVFELIERFHIECDARRAGWIQPAVSAQVLERQASRVEQWSARGAAVELLGRGEVCRLLGSERYCGGLLDRRGGSVQPLAYVRGLARAAVRAGCRLYSRTPALELTRKADEWCIRTPAGVVMSPLVILATNAYTDRLMERLRRTVIAVPSVQVATAPLSAALRNSILPGGQCASDTLRLLRYFRLDASGRLCLGARGEFAKAADHGAPPPLHRAAIREIFPQLGDVPLEYHWGGLVALTADALPHLHELAPGLLAGLGYNGRGVAMATVMGRLLARRALGCSAEELGFPLSPVRPLRLHRLSRVGALATIQLFHLLDRLG
ncbi:MAG TPA: FAD-binding oxidoreductase [Steroidobacteraceae bacterium]|nr:FAD-binding oxidoreductase [Steroidobacteraceae bacterium]